MRNQHLYPFQRNKLNIFIIPFIGPAFDVYMIKSRNAIGAVWVSFQLIFEISTNFQIPRRLFTYVEFDLNFQIDFIRTM